MRTVRDRMPVILERGIGCAAPGLDRIKVANVHEPHLSVVAAI
jgi:hypothetical protein